MLENDDFPENNSPQMMDISQAEVRNVRAETVKMHQADAEVIIADDVELQNSAAGNVKAKTIGGNMMLLGAVKADEVSVANGGVGYAQAGKISMSGYTGAVVAGSAEIRNGMAGFVAGREVQVNESRTGILLARTVNGDVNTVLDTRGALIAGLTGGLFAGLMLLLGRVLFPRK